jgi:curli biogenesis system outer membrane secretion channel CsgG
MMRRAGGRDLVVTAVLLGCLALPGARGLRPAGAEEAPQPASASQPESARSTKASLAIIPFETTPEIARNAGSDLDLLYDSLVEIFVKSNKFDVVERTKIQSVINENHFATSSIGDPSNAVQFGKLTGAQYLVVGNVLDLGVSVHTEKIPYVNEVKCTETVRLHMKVRVVRTQTGSIVSADTAGDPKSMPSQPCSRSRKETLDKAMNRVVATLVAKIIDSVYPLKVVAISGDALTLNRGEGSSFQVGSLLECFTTGEPIIDPDTGEMLGSEETPVGKISITQIMPKLSKARAEGGARIPKGAICRLVSYAAPVTPAPRARRPKVDF